MANDSLIEIGARPRGVQWLAAAAVLASAVVLLGTGITEAFFAPEKPRLIGDEKDAMEQAEANARFRDGSLARMVETDFRLRGRVRQYVAPFWAALMFKLRDVPARSVIIGDDDFLFVRDRVELDYANREGGPSVLAALCGSIGRALAAHGSELIVVPLPRKAVACRAYLHPGVDVAPEFDRQVIQTMRDHGLNVVDLTGPWEDAGADQSEEPLYIPHDSHWSRAGVQSFAHELARQVPDLPRDTAEIGTAEGWVRATLANLSHVGLRLGHPAYAWVSPRNEKALLLTPPGRETAINKGKERAEILLAGSSFSNGFFAQAVLASTLQTPVASSSLRGRPPLDSTHKGVARFKPTDLPAFVITEFPVHQAAALGPGTDGSVRSCYAIANLLGDSQRTTVLPSTSFPARRSYKATPNRPAAAFPAGTLLSSGDGALSLRLSVKSAAETQWRVVSSGMNLRIKVPAGEHARTIPFVEGLAANAGFRLIPMNAAAAASEFVLDVTTDADLTSATTLRKVAGHGGTPTFAGQGELQSHDALVLRWTGELKGEMVVRASGTQPGGSAFSRAWSFNTTRGARIAVFSLGVVEGWKLEEVAVEGGGDAMRCDLAPLSLAQ